MARGIVLGGSLFCRKSPNITSEYHGRFSTGDVIEVYNVQGYDEWLATEWTDGSRGYVKKEYVAQANDTVKVTGTNVNVRNGNGTNFGAKYQLSSPTTALVLSVASDWLEIQPNSLESGWINADYVEKTASGVYVDPSLTPGSGDTIEYSGARITANAVNCREFPGTEYVRVDQFNENDRESAYDLRGSSDSTWIRIHLYNNPYGVNFGYCLRKFVDVSYGFFFNAADLFGTGLIQAGSTGRYVMHLQHYLNRFYKQKGWALLEVDGQFGSSNSNTRNAVILFQREMGLNSDGIVGDQTKLALIAYVKNLVD